MKPINITIEEKQKIYEVKCEYHSALMCQNYDAEIKAVEGPDNRISLFPRDEESFSFIDSDPDRALAIVSMMKAFIEMVKNNNAKTIDTHKTE